MADDKTKTGGQDRQRINVHESYEVTYWSGALNTTRERIKQAVMAVGDRVEDVRQWLEKNR